MNKRRKIQKRPFQHERQAEHQKDPAEGQDVAEEYSHI